MKRDQLAWGLWVGGTLLIVLSWLQMVSAAVGWVGFALGVVGSVMSWGVRPPRGKGPSRTGKEH